MLRDPRQWIVERDKTRRNGRYRIVARTWPFNPIDDVPEIIEVGDESEGCRMRLQEKCSRHNKSVGQPPY